MSVNVPIVFIYKIRSFYSRGGNISFSKYFNQQFFDDKRDKSLHCQSRSVNNHQSLEYKTLSL